MIATVLALALGPAPVYVEPAHQAEDRETRSLHDQLMLRLLEEGYPLVPSAEHATRTLRIEPIPDGIRVEARGEDVHAFEVRTGPVLPLEAVHRAMQALDEVTPRAEPTAVPPRRYAVHVDDTPQQTSPEQVRRALVLEVLSRDGAVVPLDDAPDTVVCAGTLGDALVISSGDDVGDCGLMPLPVALTDDQPDPAALDRSIDLLMDEPEPAPAQPAQPESTTVARPVVETGLSADRGEPEPKRGPAVRLGARAGVYGRTTAADAAVGTSMRVGGEPGPGGIFDVLMVPASAPDISIFETSISAGFGWMFEVHPVVALHVQGLGGVQVHRFRQRGGEAGNRADWTAEIPVGASLRLARGLRLDLSVRAGRSGRPREHRVDDEVVWARSAWRIGGAVGLSYGWRPR